MPFLSNVYSYSGTIQSIIKIDEITYTFEESYSNQVKLKINFTGENLFGSSSGIYDKIEYNLYKDDYVIESGTHYTPDLVTGDKFKNSLFSNGVPLDEIRRFLRHKDAKTTLGYIYNRYQDEETKKLYDKALSE